MAQLRRPTHPKESRASAYAKPLGCSGCRFETSGMGFVPPIGPETSPILLLGEGPGYDEAAQGQPFVGQAGGMLNRILRLNGWSRDQFRIGNACVQCTPPRFNLHTPDAHAAIAHCRRYTDPLLAEPHQVLVPMGAHAIHRVLGVSGKHTGPEAFHGTVTQLPDGRYVVPTFHPSYLQRGAHNLIGTVSFDLQRAHEVARGAWSVDDITLVEDPPLEWFEAWAQQYLAAALADPDGVWLATDIETPDKAGGRDESELGEDDQSYQIDRVNLSCHPDEGVTVPYAGGYIAIIHRVLAALGAKVFHFGSYDRPRLLAAGARLGGALHDTAWMWKMLQSDLPQGLGFIAPFYSRYKAWKHLSGSQPVTYACIDGPQTLRVAFGAAEDLQQAGQWDAYCRHQLRLDTYVLRPATEVGVPIDRPRLVEFKKDLEIKARRFLHELQGLVPEGVRPLTPAAGMVRPPHDGAVHTKGRSVTTKGVAKKDAPDALKQDLYAQAAVVVERRVRRVVQVCKTCGAVQISKTHRCATLKEAVPQVVSEEREVTRWFWQEPFNPDSTPQVLATIKAKGHPVGKSKTSDESTDRKTLEANEKRTRDPFYRVLLDWRAVKKVHATYVEGTLRRLDSDNRLHPHFTFKPSTQRLSCTAPNIQNVVADRDESRKGLASGYRNCVVPINACRLLEVDFSAIEAVLVGWFARSPDYIRLAKLGVHSGLASHILGKPYDPEWLRTDPARAKAYLSEIKEEAKHTRSGQSELYDVSKRVVHGSAYCLTPYGMVNNFPEQFKTVAVAERFQRCYFDMAPEIPAWQRLVQQYAYDHGFLGGPGDPPFGHPFGYRHWFWSVLSYRKITPEGAAKRRAKGYPTVSFDGADFAVELGEDGKRAVAFYPQSAGRGVLTEAMLRLLDPREAEPYGSYIGDAFHGRTPFRAPIHDSLLFEVPVRAWDRVLECVIREMTRAIAQMPNPAEWGLGPYLTIDVEAKAGKVGASWGELEKVKDLPTWSVSAGGESYSPYEDALGEDDDVESLGRSVA